MPSLKLKFLPFPPVFLLQENLEVCQALCQRLAAMEKKRSELAVYLCEDPNQLSLEELFETIKTFRGLFVKALKVWCNIWKRARRKLSESCA